MDLNRYRSYFIMTKSFAIVEWFWLYKNLLSRKKLAFLFRGFEHVVIDSVESF